jgi:hypothetical protein
LFFWKKSRRVVSFEHRDRVPDGLGRFSTFFK